MSDISYAVNVEKMQFARHESKWQRFGIAQYIRVLSRFVPGLVAWVNALCHTVDQVHLANDSANRQNIGYDDSTFPAQLMAQTIQVAWRQIKRPAGVNQKRATVFRGPGAIFHRFMAVSDQPRPRLPDTQCEHRLLSCYNNLPADLISRFEIFTRFHFNFISIQYGKRHIDNGTLINLQLHRQFLQHTMSFASGSKCDRVHTTIVSQCNTDVKSQFNAIAN